MLSKTLQQEYFRNTQKMIMPESKGENNIQHAATVAANFAEMGFAMPRQMVEELATASVEDITEFYRTYMPEIRDEIGADFQYQTFYPNFPEEVIEKDALDIFLDQVIYAMSGLEIEPSVYEEAEERFPFMGEGRKRPVLAAKEKDFLDYIRQTATAQRPWTPMQRSMMKSFIEKYEKGEIYLPAPGEVKNHENAVMLTCMLEDARKKGGEKYIITVTDVLRYAAVRSAQRDAERGKGTIPEIQEAVMQGKQALDQFMLSVKYNGRADAKSLREISGMLNDEGKKLLPVLIEQLKRINEETKGSYWRTGPTERSNEFMKLKSKMQECLVGKPDKGDLYKYAALRFPMDKRPSFKFQPRMAEHIAHMIEKAGKNADIAAEMKQKEKLWKSVIHCLHVGKMHGIDRTKEAIEKICTNATIDRKSRRIEEALKKKDLTVVLREIGGRAGDFTRRFDKLLRMGVELGREEEVLAMLDLVASKAGINAALGLAGMIKRRSEAEEQRSFKVPSSGKVWKTTEKNRQPFSRELSDRVMRICKGALERRFEGKESFGRVYISPEMRDYTIPTDMREAAPGLHTYTPGSKVSMHTTEQWLRLFASWTNLEHERLDIDLSAMVYKENGESRSVSWNSEYHDGRGSVEQSMFIYSGDKQDGGPVNGGGVAEFIDLNIPKLKENGYRYVVLNVNAFTAQPFMGQPNSYFGFMFRNSDEAGRDFEPQTVQERYKLTADATQEIAGVYDIKEDKFIWIDSQIQSRVMTRSQNYAESVIEAVQQMSVLTLDELIRANTTATNSLEVYDPSQADTIFIGEREMALFLEEHPDFDFEGKTIIYPYDISYIAGELMRDGEPVKEQEEERLLDQEQEENYETH